MTPRAQLESLLAESLDACRERERSAFDAASAALPGAPLVLLGAGGLGRMIARIARENGREIAAFCDNAQRLWGAEVEGIPVRSPADAAARFGSSAVFVVTIWAAFVPGTMGDRITQLRGLGCRCVVPFHYFLWKHSA